MAVSVCSQSPRTRPLLFSLSRFHAALICRYPQRHHPQVRSCNSQPRRVDPNSRFFEVELAHPDGTELSMGDLHTYELTFDYLHNKNLKTISDILVLSPKSFVRQICVKVTRSTLLRARTGTLRHIPKATVRVILCANVFTYISWTGIIRTHNVPPSFVVRLRAMCSLQRGPPTAKVWTDICLGRGR